MWRAQNWASRLFSICLHLLHSLGNSVGLSDWGLMVATFRGNMEPDRKPLKQTFEGKLLYLHIISWVRRTRDITGFLSEPSYAMILTKIAKFFSISLYWLHFSSTSYLFCHGVDESNINILFLSNTWDRVPFSQNRDLKNMFSQKREGSMIFVPLLERTLKNLYSSQKNFNRLYFTFWLKWRG